MIYLISILSYLLIGVVCCMKINNNFKRTSNAEFFGTVLIWPVLLLILVWKLILNPWNKILDL